MKQRLKEIIILTANYYQRTMNSQILEMFLEDLEGYDEESVVEAYRAYRKDPRNKTFPLPAQIIEIMNPRVSTDSQAQEIAGRITESISRFGYVGGVKAREYIGEIGWSVVQRFGGWAEVCRDHGVSIQPGQFFAQTRDMIKAKIEIDKAGKTNDSSLLDYQPKNQITHEKKNEVSVLVQGLVKKTEIEK